MKKSKVEDLVWKIANFHTEFDLDALVSAFKNAKKTDLDLSKYDIEEEGVLRELYEMNMYNGGFPIHNMWDSKILPEGSKLCIFDYDIIYDELKRQSDLEQDRVQKFLSKYMKEFPTPPTHQVGFNFDECFIRFVDNDHFDMSIMFSNRLYWWYDLHRDLFE